MTFDLVVRGTVVLPDGPAEDSWVAVSDGKIAAIGTRNAPAAREIFDAGDDLIIPGVVDGQTHACSYGGLPGIRSTTRSAIAGGVTTIVDMPYDNPAPLNTLERLVDKIAAINEHAHADVALYGTIMPGQTTDDIEPLIEGGVVAFKISTFESSPTRFPRIASDQVLATFLALRDTSVPLGVHNEDQEIVRAYIAAAKASNRNGIEAHSGSRPPAAELAATAQFLELGAASGAHAHIVHLTTPRGFQLVDNYLADGFRATGELCVHYLWFDPDRDGAELGARMKVNPPIRPGQIDALWDEILSGRVAFVSSDHSSWPVDNKFTPSIFDAGAGVPGLETLLPAFYTAADNRGLDAAAITVEQLCERPAKFFGLWPKKGAIRLGADADLAVLSRRPQVWDSSRAHDELCWSPFDGRAFCVTVTRTYLGGQLAWDGVAVVNNPGAGRFVRRGSSHWFE
ncbi:amidohydrolase family protein (plasmid) [Rhizobium grahamii]|uniref:Amidohydrolase family protein n=1 Tax=Rhizobium grahamii TaxID=1120045 RepID=A0A5Q0CEK6_9HYPH|nr:MULTISPECIES: amidohydrolase family protein [Rhizobium]QFY63735.1 amidohydrolase family protein [Rhizobium grahamii]QRM51503.1 amidohydrolase family protein [Rhizobium sp. BG6]